MSLPPPRGLRYNNVEGSVEISRQFAIASLSNIIKKISMHDPQPLRYRNIRKDSHELLVTIIHHKNTWTTEWAEDLEKIVASARRAGVLREKT